MNGILLETDITKWLDAHDITDTIMSAFSKLMESGQDEYEAKKEAYLTILKGKVKRLEEARRMYLEALEKYNLGLSFEAYVKRHIIEYNGVDLESNVGALEQFTSELERKAYKLTQDWKERAITNVERYSSSFSLKTTEEIKYIATRKYIFDKGSGIISCDNKYLPVWLEYYSSLWFEPLITSVDNSKGKQVLWMQKRKDALRGHISFSEGFYEFHEMELEQIREGTYR